MRESARCHIAGNNACIRNISHLSKYWATFSIKPWTKIPLSNSFGEKAFKEFLYCSTYEVEMRRQEQSEEKRGSVRNLCKVVVKSPVFFVSLKVVSLYQAFYSLLDELKEKKEKISDHSWLVSLEILSAREENNEVIYMTLKRRQERDG